MPGGVYLADAKAGSFDAGGEEVRRAIDISVLGAAGAGASTFLPPIGVDAPALALAWDTWLDERFAKVLGSAFCRVHGAVGEMRIGEVLRADRTIDEAFEDAERQRSLKAAEAFLEGRESIRHMPQFARLTAAIHNADSPGHVTTLFAMQAGLYHLPRLAALVSYSYFEWLGGVVASGSTVDRDMQSFERLHPATAEVVRKLLRGETGDGGTGESSIFCVD